MSISLKYPVSPLKEKVERWLSRNQEFVLQKEDKENNINKLLQSLPDIGYDLTINYIEVKSFLRRSLIRKFGTDYVIIDDLNRRLTFSNLEYYFNIGDRPLVSWVYFSHIFSELISSAKFKNSLEIEQSLFILTRHIIQNNLNEEKNISRPQYLASMVSDAVNGESNVNNLQRNASLLYPLLHEIGHYIFQTNKKLSNYFLDFGHKLLNEKFKSSKLKDSALIYWQNPSFFDPNYGVARINENAESINTKLRNSIIEELFCDLFASTLLLLMDRFNSLPVKHLVELILRQISWGQLFQDAYTELNQISSIKKRWRGIIYDSGTIRQNILLDLLLDIELITEIFNDSIAQQIQARLKDFSIEDMKKNIDIAVIRRHYYRFLGLNHPNGDDLKYLGESIRNIISRIYRISEQYTGKIEVNHQPADWGIGSPERLRKDYHRFLLGRMGNTIVKFDDAETFIPYVEDGYNILCILRTFFWSFIADKLYELNAEIDFPVNTNQILNEISELGRFVRESEIEWIFQ
jgi:hypothetical protein